MVNALIVPLVPTGMKMGVGTDRTVLEDDDLEGKCKVVARARPQVACTWKRRAGDVEVEVKERSCHVGVVVDSGIKVSC